MKILQQILNHTIWKYCNKYWTTPYENIATNIKRHVWKYCNKYYKRHVWKYCNKYWTTRMKILQQILNDTYENIATNIKLHVWYCNKYWTTRMKILQQILNDTSEILQQILNDTYENIAQNIERRHILIMLQQILNDTYKILQQILNDTCDNIATNILNDMYDNIVIWRARLCPPPHPLSHCNKYSLLLGGCNYPPVVGCMRDENKMEPMWTLLNFLDGKRS